MPSVTYEAGTGTTDVRRDRRDPASERPAPDEAIAPEAFRAPDDHEDLPIASATLPAWGTE